MAKRKTETVEVEAQPESDPAVLYRGALVDMIEASWALRDRCEDVVTAARAWGRPAAPGVGAAVSLAHAVDLAHRALKMTQPDLMGVTVPDPAVVRVQEAQRNLDRQKRFLRWAEGLPSNDGGRAHAVALYRSGVDAAERALKRARGEAIEEDPVSFAERLDQLIGRLGVREARIVMGLPVEAQPESEPFPRG